MYHKVTDNIYVGDVTAAKSRVILDLLQIDEIINISGEDLKAHIMTHDYMLPSQELLPSEHAKTIAKLETISARLAQLASKRVLVNCDDGKNKCMLATGYYLITRCQHGYAATIEMLERLYFNDEQVKQELEDQQRLQAIDPETQPQTMTSDQLARITALREQRRAIRCLTMQSFSKLLRLTGGAKK